FIYVDKTAPASIRQSGQGLFAALTYGLGMYLGSEASGWVNQWFTKEVLEPATQQKVRVTDWTKFWLVPCIGVVVSLAFFVLLFKEGEFAVRGDPGPPATPPAPWTVFSACARRKRPIIPSRHGFPPCAKTLISVTA